MRGLTKNLITLLLVGIGAIQVNAQGLSFSYLIPTNGQLSAPISPLSIRGVGIGGAVGLESGFTLYSMPGLSMNGLPFQSNKPLTGPNWSVLIPGELTLAADFGGIGVKLLGGGFFLWNAVSHLNRGNLDRAIAEHEGWAVATSSAKMDLKNGMGWMAGIELEFEVNRKFSITSEVQYLQGHSDSSLTGTYSGGNTTIETKPLNYDNARTMLQGIEISLGVKLN